MHPARLALGLRARLLERGVRIRVRAAALNFADTLMIKGTYQVKRAPPFVPGLEAAGEVIETAPGVTRFRAGDRVMALTGAGAFAAVVLDVVATVVVPISSVPTVSPWG